MKDKLSYFTVLMGLLLLISCNSDSTSLTVEERFAVDSIYSRQFNALKSEVDSICVVISDTLYIQMVDSLTADYMEELEYLLKDRIIEE